MTRKKKIQKIYQPVELYPYQMNSAYWLKGLRRAFLGSDMGTGKTGMSAVAAKEIYESLNNGCPVYVICPLTIKQKWANEFEQKWWPGCQVEIVKKSAQNVSGKAQVYIFSYQLFMKMHTILPTCSVLICDEAQKLKNREAKRTQAILGHFQKAKKCAYTWLLSGTPFPNNVAESWTAFAFCSYGKIGEYWDFAHKYGYVSDTLWGRKAYGVRRTALHDLLAKVSPFLRRDEASNIVGLPEFQNIDIPLEPDAVTKKILAEGEQYRELVSAILDPENEASRKDLKDLDNLSALRNQLSVRKAADSLELIIDFLEQGEPVVVFAVHRAAIDYLKATLRETGYRVAAMHGGTAEKDRQGYVDDFQDGELDCIILNIQVGGVGIDLFRSRIAVFLETGDSPGDVDQGRRRLLRHGQKNFCLFHFLSYPDSFDSAIMENVARKQVGIDDFWKAFRGEEVGEKLFQDDVICE